MVESCGAFQMTNIHFNHMIWFILIAMKEGQNFKKMISLSFFVSEIVKMNSFWGS